MRLWRELLTKNPGFFDEPKVPERSVMLSEMVAVYLLFHWGTGFSEGTLFGETQGGGGEKHFAHAEDFFVRLARMEPQQVQSMLMAAYDAITKFTKPRVSSSSSGMSVVQERIPRFRYDEELTMECLKKHQPEELVRAAKRLLGFECEEFSKDAWRNLEEFIPYKDWADRLSAEHSIVTFNYDRVVEIALGDRCRIVGVEGSSSNNDQKVDLYKLHGSTDWVLRGGVVSRTSIPCTRHEEIPFIAIPGKSKDEDTETLADVWEAAGNALEEARDIHIVGYGLPESDAKARRFLLQRLRANRHKHLNINIVLGEPSFRRDRMEAILGQTLARTPLEKAVRLQAGLPPGSTQYQEVQAKKTLTLRVVNQYAQDYIQGYALNPQGGATN